PPCFPSSPTAHCSHDSALITYDTCSTSALVGRADKSNREGLPTTTHNGFGASDTVETKGRETTHAACVLSYGRLFGPGHMASPGHVHHGNEFCCVARYSASHVFRHRTSILVAGCSTLAERCQTRTADDSLPFPGHHSLRHPVGFSRVL